MTFFMAVRSHPNVSLSVEPLPKFPWGHAELQLPMFVDKLPIFVYLSSKATHSRLPLPKILPRNSGIWAGQSLIIGQGF